MNKLILIFIVMTFTTLYLMPLYMIMLPVEYALQAMMWTAMLAGVIMGTMLITGWRIYVE